MPRYVPTVIVDSGTPLDENDASVEANLKHSHRHAGKRLDICPTSESATLGSVLINRTREKTFCINFLLPCRHHHGRHHHHHGKKTSRKGMDTSLLSEEDRNLPGADVDGMSS